MSIPPFHAPYAIYEHWDQTHQLCFLQEYLEETIKTIEDLEQEEPGTRFHLILAAQEPQQRISRQFLSRAILQKERLTDEAGRLYPPVVKILSHYERLFSVYECMLRSSAHSPLPTYRKHRLLMYFRSLTSGAKALLKKALEEETVILQHDYREDLLENGFLNEQGRIPKDVQSFLRANIAQML